MAGMKAQKETREEKCEENNREAGGSGKPVENWSRCAAWLQNRTEKRYQKCDRELGWLLFLEWNALVWIVWKDDR